MTVEIAVVGSLNLDTTVMVPRFPGPGETILGSGHFSDAGGKGANQAVAAARLGRTVAMVGVVGDDAAGGFLLESLAASGVDTTSVRRAVGTGTGVAVITVARSGENSIVVDPGANSLLGAEDVRRVADLIGSAAVVLAQLEVPMGAVAAAAEACRATFVLNPAPATDIPRDVLAMTGVLVPNQSELATLVGAGASADLEEVARMARSIDGPKAVVVTLGGAGALVVVGETAIHVPAPSIVPVDPTAAGDAFCGGLADGLATGLDVVDAARWAVRCGAVAATRWGAQSSLPTRDEATEMS